MTIWKNLLEPHIPDLHTFSIHLSKVARFSYIFNLLLRIGQICILFQSPCQNLPDCHTFSIVSKLLCFILKCLIPSEPERAAGARRAEVASEIKSTRTKIEALRFPCSSLLSFSFLIIFLYPFELKFSSTYLQLSNLEDCETQPACQSCH